MNKVVQLPDTLQTSAAFPLPLRDYHLPDPVSWWPLGPGWWGLMVLGLLSGMLLLYFHSRKQQNAWRLKALELLESIFQETSADDSPHMLAKQTSILLRRICKSRFPEHSGIQLAGEEWLIYLDNCACGPEKEQIFFLNTTGKQLIHAAYDRSAESLDREALRLACLSWINALPAKTWRE